MWPSVNGCWLRRLLTAGVLKRSPSGKRSLKVTSGTYTHVFADGRDLDYAALLTLR